MRHLTRYPPTNQELRNSALIGVNPLQQSPEATKMPRGNAHQSKVHYQGKEEDFVIFVDDVKAVQEWKKDRSIPLAQVVSGFKIFVTHK